MYGSSSGSLRNTCVFAEVVGTKILVLVFSWTRAKIGVYILCTSIFWRTKIMFDGGALYVRNCYPMLSLKTATWFVQYFWWVPRTTVRRRDTFICHTESGAGYATPKYAIALDTTCVVLLVYLRFGAMVLFSC